MNRETPTPTPTPVVAPPDASRDTLYLVAWFDRKIDGVYERIQTVTASLATRVTALEQSLTQCQTTHKTEVTVCAAAKTDEIRRRDRLEKYLVPIVVSTITSLGAFVLGRITKRW